MSRHYFYKGILSAIFSMAVLSFSSELMAQEQAVDEKELIEAQTAYIDGLAAFENNNYQKALNLLNKAYVKLPDHAGINYALADTYFQINDLENAEYYSKQAIKLSPQNRWYRLQLVEIYQTSGKMNTAIKELQKTLSYHPDDSDILYQLAQTYSDYGRLQQANAIYNKLLQLEGEMITIRLEKLKNFNKLGRRDSAILELQKIRELDPSNLSTLNLLGTYYLELNKPDEARKVIDEALQYNKKNLKSLLILADIYAHLAKWDSVETTLNSVITDSSASDDIKLQVARFLYSKVSKHKQNKDIKRITNSILKKIIAEGDSGQIYALAADFFIDTGQYDLALKALKKTTDLIPTRDSAWQQRLQLLLKQHQIEEAITVGKQASKHIPQNPVILYFLGSAYLTNKQYDKAIKHLKEASELPARQYLKANIYGSLGDTYAALKDWKNAFNYYERAVELETSNPGIFNNYAYYLSLQNKNLSKAQKMAEQAVSLAPGNASYLDTVGWIYYLQGKFKKALNYLQKAVQADSSDAEILEHMGDILHKLDRVNEAKQWWQKALDKDSARTYLKDKISK